MESSEKPLKLLVFSTFAHLHKNLTGVTVNNKRRKSSNAKKAPTYDNDWQPPDGLPFDLMKRSSRARSRKRSVSSRKCVGDSQETLPRWSRSKSMPRMDREPPSRLSSEQSFDLMKRSSRTRSRTPSASSRKYVGDSQETLPRWSRSKSMPRMREHTPSKRKVRSTFSTPRSQINSGSYSRMIQSFDDSLDEDDSENDENRPNIFVLSTFADANRRASLK